MSAPTFCIGVPTYKRAVDLERFLFAVRPQLLKKPNARLVVVNDASHDDSYQRLLERFADLFEYRVQPQNGGPAMARQEAFSGAEEDFLVTTDDDCIPGPDWLDYLEAIVVSDPEIDIVAGHVEPVWHKEPGWFARLIAARSNYPGSLVTDHGLLTAVGANSAFRRSLFEKVGGYEPELSGAADDCCITQRAIKAGGRYLVAWNWLTGHKAETGLREISKRAFNYGFGSAQYTLLDQDWVLADMCSDGSIASSYRTVKRKVSTQWTDCRSQRLSWLPTLTFTAVSLLKSIQFERGWKKGMGQFSRAYKTEIPRQPELATIAVDFEDLQARKYALGL